MWWRCTGLVLPSFLLHLASCGEKKRFHTASSLRSPAIGGTAVWGSLQITNSEKLLWTVLMPEIAHCFLLSERWAWITKVTENFLFLIPWSGPEYSLAVTAVKPVSGLIASYYIIFLLKDFWGEPGVFQQDGKKWKKKVLFLGGFCFIFKVSLNTVAEVGSWILQSGANMKVNCELQSE